MTNHELLIEIAEEIVIRIKGNFPVHAIPELDLKKAFIKKYPAPAVELVVRKLLFHGILQSGLLGLSIGEGASKHPSFHSLFESVRLFESENRTSTNLTRPKIISIDKKAIKRISLIVAKIVAFITLAVGFLAGLFQVIDYLIKWFF